MSIIYEQPLNKDWRLVMTLGGSRIVHARGCDFIKDWDINGCQELLKLKPMKHKLCPQCSKLAITTLGAVDYVENLPKYKRFFKTKTFQ